MDKITPEKRSYNMSRILGKDTKPELFVRKYLFGMGLRFRKNDKRLPGHPDIVFPKYKTVVFVHGCFWHGHEGCKLFVMPKSNVEFWENTASQYIETVYKDMMKNIYAGALYKTGQEDRAGEIFAEQGDYQSLMTMFYQKRSYAAIRQEYLKNPNSLVLPFLMQDFVNNAQEAYDAEYDEGGFG